MDLTPHWHFTTIQGRPRCACALVTPINCLIGFAIKRCERKLSALHTKGVFNATVIVLTSIQLMLDFCDFVLLF